MFLNSNFLKFSFPGFRFIEGASNARKLEKENVCLDHFPDFNLEKVLLTIKNMFTMKNLTDFLKTMETGVDPHLDRILAIAGLPPSSMSPLLIYTPG